MDSPKQRELLPPAALDDLTDLMGGDVDELAEMLGSVGLHEEAEQLARDDEDEDDGW
ncbi:hypothetical protein [Streptomyces sp. NPDC055036]